MSSSRDVRTLVRDSMELLRAERIRASALLNWIKRCDAWCDTAIQRLDHRSTRPKHGKTNKVEDARQLVHAARRVRAKRGGDLAGIMTVTGSPVRRASFIASLFVVESKALLLCDGASMHAGEDAMNLATMFPWCYENGIVRNAMPVRELSVQQLVDQVDVLRYNWPFMPPCQEVGRLIGVLRLRIAEVTCFSWGRSVHDSVKMRIPCDGAPPDAEAAIVSRYAAMINYVRSHGTQADMEKHEGKMAEELETLEFVCNDVFIDRMACTLHALERQMHLREYSKRHFRWVSARAAIESRYGAHETAGVKEMVRDRRRIIDIIQYTVLGDIGDAFEAAMREDYFGCCLRPGDAEEAAHAADSTTGDSTAQHTEGADSNYVILNAVHGYDCTKLLYRGMRAPEHIIRDDKPSSIEATVTAVWVWHAAMQKYSVSFYTDVLYEHTMGGSQLKRLACDPQGRRVTGGGRSSRRKVVHTDVEYPKILQRANAFHVAFRGHIFECEDVYDVLHMWALIVIDVFNGHTADGGNISSLFVDADRMGAELTTRQDLLHKAMFMHGAARVDEAGERIFPPGVPDVKLGRIDPDTERTETSREVMRRYKEYMAKNREEREKVESEQKSEGAGVLEAKEFTHPVGNVQDIMGESTFTLDDFINPLTAPGVAYTGEDQDDTPRDGMSDALSSDDGGKIDIDWVDLCGVMQADIDVPEAKTDTNSTKRLRTDIITFPRFGVRDT